MTYQISTKVFGDWEIVREIGHGAYGHVYQIEKTEYGVTARSAMKVIRIPTSEKEVQEAFSEGMDEESVSHYFRGFVDDLLKEIDVMTKLSGHTNIVGYQDHHVVEHTDRIGWDILVRMELLEPLVDYQLQHGSFSEEKIIQLGIDISNALMTCEENGIIHRDVKPDNIFVDASGNFKLGDFGVAKAMEKTTGGLSKKGTESYMAPEVYFGRPYGKTVDIYSLGLVLYRYANRGRLPFYPLDSRMVRYADKEEALSKRMKGTPLPVPCEASDGFIKVILRACAADPKERFASAREFKAALENLKYQRKDGQNTKKEEWGMPHDQNYTFRVASSESQEETVGVRIGESEKTTAAYNGSEEETIGVIDDCNKMSVKAQGAQDKDIEEDDQGGNGNGNSNSGSVYDFTPDTDAKKNTPLIIGALAALGIVAAFIIYALLPKTKAVTINGGTGSGTYKPRETVSIKADKKEGYDFTGWTVKQGDITLLDPEAEETTFMMGKEAVEITASYEEKTYLLTVEGGVIQGEEESTGNFHEGDRITVIPSEKEDYVFTGWEVSDEMVVVQNSGENLVFNMPPYEFTVVAEYEEKTYLLTLDGGVIKGTENSSGYFHEGDQVTIIAPDEKEGFLFSGWVSTEGEAALENADEYETTIVIGKEDVYLSASYEGQKHHLTVIGGEGGGDYRFGETVTITADPSQEGFVFSRWDTEDSDLLIADNEEISFEMPDEDITIIACYSKEKKKNESLAGKSLRTGGTVSFGKYEQDSNYYNGTEELEWIVLDKKDQKALLITKYAIDFQPYNTYRSYSTYDTCSLRAWLNNVFFVNAFSDEEQDMILTTRVTADENPVYDSYEGGDVSDKVFLLSYGEASKYFAIDEDRKCNPTTYAINDGTYTDEHGNAWWWLRGSGMSNDTGCVINIDGTLNCYGIYVDTGGSVRPAIWVSLSD